MATRSRAPRVRAAESRNAKLGLPQSAAGREFQKLVDIMVRLRAPNGCPWDREQTIQSLRGFVLEETYEVLDAIDRADHEDLLGEIGDLLRKQFVAGTSSRRAACRDNVAQRVDIACIR